WRDLLQFARGPDRHRELATPLQHDQAPRLTWIQVTSTGGVCARLRRVAGCATPSGYAGHAGETAHLKLIFHLDHSAGADHLGCTCCCCCCCWTTGPCASCCSASRSQLCAVSRTMA